MHGHPGVISIILDEGVEVNVTDDFGRRPLYSTIGAGHSDAVKVLLRKGVDVNVTGRHAGHERWTLLHRAVLHGHPKVTEVLLKEGAWVSQTSDRGKAPFF